MCCGVLRLPLRSSRSRHTGDVTTDVKLKGTLHTTAVRVFGSRNCVVSAANLCEPVANPSQTFANPSRIGANLPGSRTRRELVANLRSILGMIRG
eukprot:301993-Prymnesium_polylepis.1